MTREDIIRMAREAELIMETDCTTPWVEDHDLTPYLERFAALVAAAERKSKPHSLGSGEMELSLRREHKGELFEYRYRFTAEQVMHGPDWLVEETAKKLDFEMDHAIRARGQA